MGSILIEINEESVQHLGAEDFKRLHVIVAEEAYRRLKQATQKPQAPQKPAEPQE